MPVVITAEEMNRRNKVFWARENSLMQERLGRPELLALALKYMADEASRLIPMKHRMGLEQSLQLAEESSDILLKSVHVAAARRAGSAPKADALQMFIKQLVLQRPSLSLSELTKVLEAQQGLGFIEDFDKDEISFVGGRKGSKSASRSGLKDRLSRAKHAVGGGKSARQSKIAQTR
jgi:hypothetical protein